MKISIPCIILLLTLIFGSNNCIAQQGPPPPTAMPKEQNKEIIDKIIETTEYQKYFIQYCANVISKTATSEYWPIEKTTAMISKINFNSFKFTIHNLFASYSVQELNELQILYNSDKKYKTDNQITRSSMVEANLKSYANNLIDQNRKQ